MQVLTSLETSSRNVFCWMCDSKRDIPVVLKKMEKISASFWSNPNSDCTLCHGNSIFFYLGKIVKIFASGNSGVNWCGYNHWDENGEVFFLNNSPIMSPWRKNSLMIHTKEVSKCRKNNYWKQTSQMSHISSINLQEK